MGEVVGVRIAGLPARVGPQRADQLDAVFPGGVEDVVHADVGGIRQLLVRLQPPLDQVFVAARDRLHIGQ
ncbi:hypothetical protein [Streptomyces sp. NBC_01431]|uniref:hypothetical protein n=1 Tax=Streptomyces sp. NBC_01431 TaxID=2903863 RepID=UPI002E375A9E|nr:hypothetical protein [Streptomyces sp. NBC_01431]